MIVQNLERGEVFKLKRLIFLPQEHGILIVMREFGFVLGL